MIVFSNIRTTQVATNKPIDRTKQSQSQGLISKFGHHLWNAIKTIIFAVDLAIIILVGLVSGSSYFFDTFS